VPESHALPQDLSSLQAWFGEAHFSLFADSTSGKTESWQKR